MHFRRNLGKFFIYEFFYLEDIDIGSPNLHTIEIFSHATSHKNLMILAAIRAELVGGGADSAPLPSRARNSEPHSQARVKGKTLQISELVGT